MIKKNKNRSKRDGGGFERLPSGSEFYTSNPTEAPLNDDTGLSNSQRVRKTDRHQAILGGRREEKMDPREKLALLAILKVGVMILVLGITFFMLRKGIGLYEESVWLDHMDVIKQSPVLQEVVLVEDFDIQDQTSREKFAERVELWKKADRLVRSADTLLQRNIYDQAIEQCQDALRLNPTHRGALERLSRLYYTQENYVEAVNAYIRLLSIDPSKQDVQKCLIQSLDALGDDAAVKYMAEWYLDQNMFDVDIQRYLANALYSQENFKDAVLSYAKVLSQTPKDVLALENQAAAYMHLQQFEKALVVLNKLREIDYRNQRYYKQISICDAQLFQTQDTVKMLSRAAQLFGINSILGWIKSPQFDPIREDRVFQVFTTRIAGDKSREWIKAMAQDAEAAGSKKLDVGPQLEMPGAKDSSGELLSPKR